VTPFRVLSVAVLALAAGGAQAQLPRFGFSVPGYTYQYGFGQSVSYSPYFPNLPRVPGMSSTQSYSLPGMGPNGPYTLNYGIYRNTSSGSRGGVGFFDYPSPYTGGYNSVSERQSNAVRAAQRAAQWDAAATAGVKDFDRAVRDARAPADPKAVALDRELLEPSDEVVRSGAALNKLAELIRAEQKGGKKAQPGLYAPDLTSKIVFGGGPAAAAANVFREPELEYPDALLGGKLDDPRAALDKAFAAVAKDAYTGKKTNPAAVDRLTKAVAAFKESARQAVADARLADAKAASEFLARLDEAARYLADAKSSGVGGERWSSTGATVAEVVAHLDKFGLTFAPAAPADETAYRSLHRGLLAYLLALRQAK
jgi:hypothetical protein